MSSIQRKEKRFIQEGSANNLNLRSKVVNAIELTYFPCFRHDLFDGTGDKTSLTFYL